MLSTGSRLGPYQIVAPLGAGGMGEVYRAHDAHLNRDVALKVLPERFALDPDRLARFKREAQILASLNHPNIAAIFRFEASTSVHALALELVDGPTLADRLSHGAIPLDETLHVARQIAEALEAAHEHGIVHRDLKPSNIKLRPDGTVKVLDFGLAKAFEAVGGHGADVSASPTITSPAVTQTGVILGTAAYMSPEQAKGKTADRRTDLWAFGCALYEMLAGRRAFEGEGVSETIAGVLKSEVDWTSLPSTTPPSIHRLLRRCLAKELKDRIGDASTARLEIDAAPHGGDAYQSNESGRFEVYVARFPGASGRLQASTNGGTSPRWRRDGKELFYVSADSKMTAVDVNGNGAAFSVGNTTPLFSTRIRDQFLGIPYDVSADGQRFLINTFADQTTPPSISLILNWPALMKK